ncbi:MAG: (Fe-S)-binding protein [Thermoleophilia bacterium]|jgi:Fe-S oxidoreductase
MLADFREYMIRCARCSNCKFIPQAMISNSRYAYSCPSITKYLFHTYSGGGRLITALAMNDGRIDYSDKLIDIIYQCQLCGACDISCKYGQDIEVLQPLYELRVKCVGDGQLHPVHMLTIDGLRKEDNMLLQRKADRGNWAEGLDVKNITQEGAEVYFHTGCRYSYDEELWPIARAAVQLLQKAGVDVAIAGKDENCCAGRAYDLGYLGELTKYAESNVEMLKTAKAKTVVTCCSDCYHAFKVLYDKSGLKKDIKVLHITEYLDHLIQEGRLKPSKTVPMTVTYHDPCHLGRLGEPWVTWNGVISTNPTERWKHVPEKEIRKGTYGIYEPPRNVLKSIRGLKLIEMTRIKEYTWCCGAGGGVVDAYPEFSEWTAAERIQEALDTGAEALVTTCPWCIRNFRDSVEATGADLKVYDVVELFQQSIED